MKTKNWLLCLIFIVTWNQRELVKTSCIFKSKAFVMPRGDNTFGTDILPDGSKVYWTTIDCYQVQETTQTITLASERDEYLYLGINDDGTESPRKLIPANAFNVRIEKVREKQ